jgi:hypothetical protein
VGGDLERGGLPAGNHLTGIYEQLHRYEPAVRAPIELADTTSPSGSCRAPSAIQSMRDTFYNHFQSKDELFHAAVEDALDTFGARLDELTVGLDDPAEVFAQSFRLAARLHRREPELSKVLLHNGLALVGSDSGLAPWARRDIDVVVHAGWFGERDPELSLAIIAGAILWPAAHDHLDRDDAEAAD